MLDALLSLIPGGSLTAIGGAVVAALVAVWRIYAAGKKSGQNEAKAKEADHYARYLDEIAGAHDARNRVRPDRVPDDDKYRRD